MTFPSNSASDSYVLNLLDNAAVTANGLMGLSESPFLGTASSNPVGTTWGPLAEPLLATATTVQPLIDDPDILSPLASDTTVPAESFLELTGQPPSTCSHPQDVLLNGMLGESLEGTHRPEDTLTPNLEGTGQATGYLEKTPGAAGQAVTTRVYWTSRHAGYDNELGLFWVDDAAGRIGGLLPGAEGYAEAALAEERRQVIFHTHQTAGAITDLSLPGDTYFGWYLIQDTSSTVFLNTNPSNQIDAGPLAFFSLLNANPDGFQHLQLLPHGEYTWEDWLYGGDRDFNDLVFRYEFVDPPAPLPHLEIDDLTVIEGDAGVQEARFTVRLSAQSGEPVTVDFATGHGTAIEGTDYSAVQGQLTFAPGAVTQTITVPIWGDRVAEPDTTFYLELAHPVNAQIMDGYAIGTLQDDDEPTHPSAGDGGKIVVANDEWTTSNTGFARAPDTSRFIANLADYFAPDSSGNFLAYSNNFGLTGSSLAQAMAAHGHAWTVSIKEPFTLEHLQQYDAVFVGGYVADNSVLIDYVKGGGNVYLMAGTAAVGNSSDEAATWAPFLNYFGLAYAETYNPIVGNLPVSASTHSIFAGVQALFQENGNSIVDLDAEDELGTILAWGSDGLGLYAIYDPS